MSQWQRFHTRCVPIFPLPHWIDISRDIRLMLESSVEKLRQDAVINAGALAACIDGDTRPERHQVNQSFHLLWHDLSEDALGNARSKNYASSRSDDERLVFDETFDAFLSHASEGARGLLHWVKIVGCVLNDGHAVIRSSDVFSKRNRAGYRSKFPPSTMIDERVAQIQRFIYVNYRKNPLFTAVIAMVSMTSCHPLYDGNGRLGRVLFNAILKASGAMERAYIPLYDFFWVSGLGYEIRVLEARDNANWEGLLSYMNDLISVGLVTLSYTNKDKEDLV